MRNCTLNVILRSWILLCSPQTCWRNMNKIRESRRSLFGSLLSEGKDQRASEFPRKGRKNGSFSCIIYKENFVESVHNDEIAKYAKARDVYLSVSRSLRKFARSALSRRRFTRLKQQFSTKFFRTAFCTIAAAPEPKKAGRSTFREWKQSCHCRGTCFFLHFYIINEWPSYITLNFSGFL